MKKTLSILIVILIAFSEVNGQGLFGVTPRKNTPEKDSPKQPLSANDDEKLHDMQMLLTSFLSGTPGSQFPAAPPKTAIDYSIYSDAVLKQALTNSQNIDDIQLIQNELDKRKPAMSIPSPIPVNEFDKYSNAQLNDLLNNSVAKEDFDTAEKIKNELANRKKTLDNLKLLLDDAVKKEDFEKAAEIQEAIKKLEK